MGGHSFGNDRGKNIIKENDMSNKGLIKVYIAGMVGDLTDDVYYYECKAKFEKRERELRKLGYTPVNPMKLVKRGAMWPDAMRECVRALTLCKYISPLPDASQSKGAIIEMQLAKHFGMSKIFPSKM